MKRVCWLLILVLLLGCFVGCQQTPESTERSIENEDGTLSDWMKEEIEEVYKQKYGANLNGWWWNPHKPLDSHGKVYYYGTYDGYVVYYIQGYMDALTSETFAGYEFVFPTDGTRIMAYKEGEIYKLRKLFEQGLIDEEAIRIAHEHYTEINEIKEKYRKQVAENE